MRQQLIRYATAGLANTAIGYGVFLIALHWFGISLQFSNALGYAIALLVAYGLNKYFVFTDQKASKLSGLLFCLCFGLAFTGNQVTLFVLDSLTDLYPEVSQLIAMFVYTVSFFVLNKRVVFSGFGKS